MDISDNMLAIVFMIASIAMITGSFGYSMYWLMDPQDRMESNNRAMLWLLGSLIGFLFFFWSILVLIYQKWLILELLL